MTTGLTLIIPCFNEAATIKQCILRCLELGRHGIDLEILVVDDCSKDASADIVEELQKEHTGISLYRHERNMGKGAALRTGFMKAAKEYVGIQDADMEYNPMDYLDLLEPLIKDKADVVYGSRYLAHSPRRVLYYWHSLMNRCLTSFSNMFTNLDITDMETCYKLFRRDVIQRLAPQLRENRFGFEPEITCLVARSKCRVYELAIDYDPRSYEQGKKIGWRDGMRALYCVLHYGAPYAPAPMQFIIYFFIGAFCALANIAIFALLLPLGLDISVAVAIAFIIAALLNYLLCLLLLFRHRSRWSAPGELLSYLVVVVIMLMADIGMTLGFTWLGVTPILSKTFSTILGFFGNFILRKYLVFATPVI